MGSFSDYLENELLDHVFKTGSFSAPTNIYVALFVGSPLDTGAGGAEVSTNNYSRVLHEAWDAASSGATENTGTITFPTASGSWGTVDYFAIFDASLEGNMLAWGQLTASKTVGDGDVVQFADGAIDVTLD